MDIVWKIMFSDNVTDCDSPVKVTLLLIRILINSLEYIRYLLPIHPFKKIIFPVEFCLIALLQVFHNYNKGIKARTAF